MGALQSLWSQTCSLEMEPLEFDVPVKIDVPGDREGTKYYILDNKSLKELQLEAKKEDLWITAEADDQLLKGIYFAESVCMPEKKTWFNERSENLSESVKNRQKSLSLNIKYEDLNAKARATRDFHFTVATDARPKMKADNVMVANPAPLKVQFLVTKVKARRQIKFVFAIPSAKESDEQEDGKERKEEKAADEKKEGKEGGGSDSALKNLLNKHTTEKIFYPPKLPWEEWNLGLTFKSGTTEVEEAVGLANDIRLGWKVIKIDDRDVTAQNLPEFLKELEIKCAPSENVKRLDPLPESKDREV